MTLIQQLEYVIYELNYENKLTKNIRPTDI